MATSGAVASPTVAGRPSKKTAMWSSSRFAAPLGTTRTSLVSSTTTCVNTRVPVRVNPGYAPLPTMHGGAPRSPQGGRRGQSPAEPTARRAAARVPVPSHPALPAPPVSSCALAANKQRSRRFRGSWYLTEGAQVLGKRHAVAHGLELARDGRQRHAAVVARQAVAGGRQLRTADAVVEHNADVLNLKRRGPCGFLVTSVSFCTCTLRRSRPVHVPCGRRQGWRWRRGCRRCTVIP